MFNLQVYVDSPNMSHYQWDQDERGNWVSSPSEYPMRSWIDHPGTSNSGNKRSLGSIQAPKRQASNRLRSSNPSANVDNSANESIPVSTETSIPAARHPKKQRIKKD